MKKISKLIIILLTFSLITPIPAPAKKATNRRKAKLLRCPDDFLVEPTIFSATPPKESDEDPFRNILIKIAGLTITNQEAKRILFKLAHLYQTAKPSLAALAAACDGSTKTVDEKYRKPLGALNLISTDGTVRNFTIEEIVNSAITITAKPGSKNLKIELKNEYQLYDYYLRIGMLRDYTQKK